MNPFIDNHTSDFSQQQYYATPMERSRPSIVINAGLRSNMCYPFPSKKKNTSTTSAADATLIVMNVGIA